MKIKKPLLTMLLFFCAIVAYAQKDKSDQSFKRRVLQAPIEVAFDKTVDYLMAKNLFIVAMDKQAGFIQARQFVKDKRVLSAKMGDRKTLNFILRPKDSETTVALNIYVEQYSFGGDVHSRNYYYEDKGILVDKIAYEEILNDLQREIRPQG